MNPQARFDIVGDDKSKAAVASALGGMSSLVSKAGVVGAAVSALSSVSMVALLKSQIDAADEMSKLSQKMGVTTESASALAYAADFSGVSNEQLSASFKNLSGNMLDSQRAGSDQQKLFSALGVSAVDMDGNLRSADDVMADLADSFAGMPDGILKTDAAVKLLGRSGAEMLPMLNGGSAGLADMRYEAKMFGNVISGDTGQAAEEFNDNLTRLAWIGKGIANEVLPAMLTGLNLLANAFGVGAKSAGNQTYQMAEQLTKLNDQYKSLYLNVETTRKAADGGNEYAQKALGGYQAAANKVLGEIKAVEDKIAAINGGSGVNTKALTAALSGDKGPKKTKDKGDNGIDQEIEAQRKAMIALYTEAYPLAMQTTEQWAQQQSALSEVWLNGQENAEEFGVRMMELAKIAYPSSTESAEEYGTRMAVMAEKDREYLERSKSTALKWSDAWSSAGNRMAAGIGDATAAALFTQEDFGAAAGAIARGVAQQMISSLVEIGVKKVALSLLSQSLVAKETVTSVVAAKVVTNAWTPAAVVTSTASFGSAAAIGIGALIAGFALAKSSFGGGGGGGSSAAPSVSALTNNAPTPAANNSQPQNQRPAQSVTIIVQGNLVDMSQLSRELRTYDIQLERDTI